MCSGSGSMVYFANFFSSLLSPHKIEVFACLALPAESVGPLALQCPHLRTLNIGRVPKVSEACRVRSLENLREITTLNVAGLNMVRLLGPRLLMKFPCSYVSRT